MRIIGAALLFIGLAGHAHAAGEPAITGTPDPSFPQSSQSQQEDWRSLLAVEQIAACCKICRKGKACGDSCIKKSNSCHEGQGCACDAE